MGNALGSVNGKEITCKFSKKRCKDDSASVRDCITSVTTWDVPSGTGPAGHYATFQSPFISINDL